MILCFLKFRQLYKRSVRCALIPEEVSSLSIYACLLFEAFWQSKIEKRRRTSILRPTQGFEVRMKTALEVCDADASFRLDQTRVISAVARQERFATPWYRGVAF